MNPAVDMNITSQGIHPKVVNRTQDSFYSHNGKGINLTRVLRHFGMDSAAVGFFGGFSGRYIVDSLREEGIPVHPIQVEETTRINIFLNDGSQEYKFVGEGAHVSPEAQQELLKLLETLRDFFFDVGFGKLTFSQPEEHDRIIAFTSQLAHIVSSAYVKSPEAQRRRGFSAGSFKDMTRVAKLNEEMWTELFLENQDALVREIDTLVEELAAFAYTIRRGDRENLLGMLRRARQIKESIDKDC